MTVELSLRGSSAVAIHRGSVRITDYGTLRIELDGHPPFTVKVSDDRSGYIECWRSPSWLVAVGDEGDRIASVDLDTGAAKILPGLARLDFGGGYDPGGMFRVAFFTTSDSSKLVVETEVALACVVQHAVEWQYVHGDPTCRVVSVEDRAVTLSSEHGPMIIDLATGQQVL